MISECCNQLMRAISVGTRFETRKTYAFECPKCKRIVPPAPRIIPDDEWDLIVQDWERRQFLQVIELQVSNESTSPPIAPPSPPICRNGHLKSEHWKIIPATEKRASWGFCQECRRLREIPKRAYLREQKRKLEAQWKEAHPEGPSYRTFIYRQNREHELGLRRERDRKKKEEKLHATN